MAMNNGKQNIVFSSLAIKKCQETQTRLGGGRQSVPGVDQIDLTKSLEIKDGNGHRAADDSAVRSVQSHRAHNRKPFMDALVLKPVLNDKPAVSQRNYKVTVTEMSKQNKKNAVEIYGVDGFPEGKMVEYEHYNHRPRVFRYHRGSDAHDV